MDKLDRTCIGIVAIFLIAAVVAFIAKADQDKAWHGPGGGGQHPCAGMVDPDSLLDFGEHAAFVVARWPRYEDGVFIDCEGGADWLQTRCDYVRAVTWCLWRGEHQGIEQACCPVVILWDQISEPNLIPIIPTSAKSHQRKTPAGVYSVAGRRVAQHPAAVKSSGIYFYVPTRGAKPEKVLVLR